MNKLEAKRILNEVLGYFKESGHELLFKCPSCNHHKHKLSVNLDKNAFKCWICDYRGRNLRRLVRRHGSYVQLNKWDKITNRFDLANFADLFMDQSDREEEIKVELPQEFRTLTSKDRPLISNPAFRYLRERGLSKDDILKWKIGYCSDGEYAGRVVIPSFNENGYANYIVARSYGRSWPRYKNPPASRDIIFNELYINWDEDLIIVEGVFDAIKAGNAIPLLGSTLRENSALFQAIVKNGNRVFLALDEDASKKTRSIASLLLKYGVEVYEIDTSGVEDVGEMSKGDFQRRKNNASIVEKDNYLLQRLFAI